MADARRFIDDWRRKIGELSISSPDRMFSLISKSIDLMGALAVDENNLETLMCSLESLDSERAISMKYDFMLGVPLRQAIYGLIESIHSTAQLIIDRRRGGNQQMVLVSKEDIMAYSYDNHNLSPTEDEEVNVDQMDEGMDYGGVEYMNPSLGCPFNDNPEELKVVDVSTIEELDNYEMPYYRLDDSFFSDENEVEPIESTRKEPISVRGAITAEEARAYAAIAAAPYGSEFDGLSIEEVMRREQMELDGDENAIVATTDAARAAAATTANHNRPARVSIEEVRRRSEMAMNGDLNSIRATTSTGTAHAAAAATLNRPVVDGSMIEAAKGGVETASSGDESTVRQKRNAKLPSRFTAEEEERKERSRAPTGVTQCFLCKKPMKKLRPYVGHLKRAHKQDMKKNGRIFVGCECGVEVNYESAARKHDSKCQKTRFKVFCRGDD